MLRHASIVTLCIVFFAPFGAFAFGSDEYWVSGFGQGIEEAIIRKGPGNSIYVTCDVGAGRNASKIEFTLRDKNPTGSSVLLTFDGKDPEEYSIWNGEIRSDCRACASVYVTVRDKLRSHSSVHVRFENGDAARFTLARSSKAISLCKPDFWR